MGPDNTTGVKDDLMVSYYSVTPPSDTAVWSELLVSQR